MIATITEGIAHGTSASERASQRPRSGWLSRSASPSASTNWMAVTETAQISADLERVDEQAVVDQRAEVLRAR